MSRDKTLKLDYRCQGQGCEEKKECRRFLYGPEAKSSMVPFAAFDARLASCGRCDGFMARRDAARHNALVQPTDASLSRQVGCNDGLGLDGPERN